MKFGFSNSLKKWSAVVLGVAMVCAPSHAQNAASEKVFNLDEVTCGEVLALSEENSGYALILLLGYVSAKNDAPLLTATSIGTAVKEAYEACSDAPELRAVEAYGLSRNEGH